MDASCRVIVNCIHKHDVCGAYNTIQYYFIKKAVKTQLNEVKSSVGNMNVCPGATKPHASFAQLVWHVILDVEFSFFSWYKSLLFCSSFSFVPLPATKRPTPNI